MDDTDRAQTFITAGIQGLLYDVIDYAGIFPPASLPLGEAIKNFAHYRSTPEEWLLGRFVVPAYRLSDLDAYSSLFAEDPPFRFSVLAGGGHSASTFIDELGTDLHTVAAFRGRHGESVRIEAIEMRVPESLLNTDVVSVGRFLDDVDALLERHDLQAVDMFFEVPLDQNHRQTVPVVAGALHSFNRTHTVEQRGGTGLKMRTGGTKPDAFPSADVIAFAIAACRDANVPFKATAGLHHPVRHFDEGVEATMHGFFNVFVAAVLATAEQADESDLVSVLVEEDGGAFHFDEDGLSWRGHRATNDAVARTRRDLAISFGSCSFTEPVEDLRELGHL